MTPASIVLASASPRRSELLASLGFEFTVVPSTAEELHDDRWPVADLCQRNAELKAREVARRFPDSLIIGADTLVALDRKLFGKPRDLEHARAMLAELSGRTHEVVTGVCFIHRERIETFSDATSVSFRPLSFETIEAYVREVTVLDKAGAYGIQERGEMLVEKISGSFSNVMGFPTEKFKERIREWNLIP